jgi:hypothetical protein
MRRDVLALVHDDTVRLLDGRLPEWNEADGEATFDVLMTHSGGSHYRAPTIRLGPGDFLHVLGAWDPLPGEWVGLDDVPGTPPVTQALRRALRQ